MLKPVSILALDGISAPLAAAVQQRVATACGLDDLAQARELTAGSDLAQTIQSIHAQRQRPDSPLRLRDDISQRELVLLLVAAAGPARMTLLETATQVRRLYEMRRLASLFSIEIVCLLPEIAAGDHAAAYGLLKALSAADSKPFNEVWLLDATNASRVRFGALDASLDVYAGAIAGMLLFEPEMSGALPGIHPRGMPPAFSSFGYAQLVFPREVALQRLEPRFALELIRDVLLSGSEGPPPLLRAKQFVVAEEVAVPMSRIGIDAGQSLFKRFHPKSVVNEKTRSAEELIAAVRAELKAYRETTHLQNLETLARHGEQAVNDIESFLTRTIDMAVDAHGYDTSIRGLEALLDPLPDLRADADVAPRNLATEIHSATAALDARLGFAPNTAASDAARKRVRELDNLLQDQKLVADTLAPVTAADSLGEMEAEKEALSQQLPETLFAEEAQNNAARNAARDAEGARLAGETEAREQQLRELFVQLPRAEQTLREALEARRAWIKQQLIWAAAGLSALYGIPFVFSALTRNLDLINSIAITGSIVFAGVSLLRYVTGIAPRVREAREALERLRALIVTTDKAKNAAHNDQLQFEYDVAHRRTTLNVLRQVREAAKTALDGLRTRRGELEMLANSLTPSSISASGLTIAIVDDADVDAWYERTSEDRKPFLREFPMRRSESRRLALDELQARITTYAATAFEGFRSFTLAGAAASVANEAKLGQRLRRFAETSAPLIELRDDDLPAQQAMQRDVTLWVDSADAAWMSQLQRRFPESHAKAASDPLCVHALSRALHFPGYVLGQIDFYRAQYEAAEQRDYVDVADLVPIPAPVRAAYEQVLLGRATGIIELRSDGQLASANAVLGDSHLAAAQRLAAADGASLRERLDLALTPRLSIAGDVERDLRRFMEWPALSQLDRNLLDELVKRYAAVF
jgi:hypothetical protein